MQEFLKGSPGFGRCDTCLRHEVRSHNIEEEGGKKLYHTFHYEQVGARNASVEHQGLVLKQLFTTEVVRYLQQYVCIC